MCKAWLRVDRNISLECQRRPRQIAHFGWWFCHLESDGGYKSQG
jgi:hypothetical protein